AAPPRGRRRGEGRDEGEPQPRAASQDRDPVGGQQPRPARPDDLRRPGPRRGDPDGRQRSLIDGGAGYGSAWRLKKSHIACEALTSLLTSPTLILLKPT